MLDVLGTLHNYQPTVYHIPLKRSAALRRCPLVSPHTSQIETRDELATELKRRKDVLGALAARGQEAVLAVADAAKKAADDAMKTAATEAREADKSGEVRLLVVVCKYKYAGVGEQVMGRETCAK